MKITKIKLLYILILVILTGIFGFGFVKLLLVSQGSEFYNGRLIAKVITLFFCIFTYLTLIIICTIMYYNIIIQKYKK